MKHIRTLALSLAVIQFGLTAPDAHEISNVAASSTDAKPLPLVPEDSLTFEVATVSTSGQPVSGQGAWRFRPAGRGVLPIPDKAAGSLKPAHGTLIVEAPKDTVYWGLQGVGWIGFRKHLTESWIVEGDPAFSQGNLHGADLLPREGKSPLVAVADNMSGDVYLSDTTFKWIKHLGWPEGEHYSERKQFKPTDVAFIGQDRMVVTDGYGKAILYEMPVSDPGYDHYHFGGKADSRTPHGVTYDGARGRLLVSARPEGQIKGWNPDNRQWLDTVGLPAGSTVCDVDIWGDYALAPCLDGPNKSPGPIYILNLKKKTIASIIKPKEELGFGQAQHIHDAAWYVTDNNGTCELWIVFTYWNPGGIGAVRMTGK